MQSFSPLERQRGTSTAYRISSTQASHGLIAEVYNTLLSTDLIQEQKDRHRFRQAHSRGLCCIYQVWHLSASTMMAFIPEPAIPSKQFSHRPFKILAMLSLLPEKGNMSGSLSFPPKIRLCCGTTLLSAFLVGIASSRLPTSLLDLLAVRIYQLALQTSTQLQYRKNWHHTVAEKLSIKCLR